MELMSCALGSLIGYLPEFDKHFIASFKWVGIGIHPRMFDHCVLLDSGHCIYLSIVCFSFVTLTIFPANERGNCCGMGDWRHQTRAHNQISWYISYNLDKAPICGILKISLLTKPLLVINFADNFRSALCV